MEQHTILYNDRTAPQLIAKEINKLRRLNKNVWLQINLENQNLGKVESLKIYNTWIQKSTTNKFTSAMGQSVGQFKHNIENGFKALLNEC